MERETYAEFLARIHREDVERGVALHKAGDCKVCEEKRALSAQEGKT